MARRFLVIFIALVATFAMPITALAGSMTLHPAGFGEHSRANWKAKQGLPDSTPSGNPSQALYFQKMTATTTVAAGVAVIKGLEGQSADVLNGLQWYHRVDGHCGAGAPRWNVNLRDDSGNNYTVFFGCYAAAHTPAPVPASTTWCIDTYDAAAIDAGILAATGLAPAALTIRSLVIVFDEGTDNPIPQPPGCPLGASQPGFVYLDNITVTVNATPHTWTSATDNGNNAYMPPTIGPSVAVAEELVPVSDILAILQDAFADVPITSWILYPDVEIALPGLP